MSNIFWPFLSHAGLARSICVLSNETYTFPRTSQVRLPITYRFFDGSHPAFSWCGSMWIQYDQKFDIKFICLNTSYLCLMAWTIINPDWKYMSLCLQCPVTASLLAPLWPNSLTMHTVSGSFCTQYHALAEIPGRKPLFLYAHQCGWSPGIFLVCQYISHKTGNSPCTTVSNNFHALTYW